MVYDMTHTLEYDNATENIVLAYNDTKNHASQHCLLIKNSNMTVISTTCSNQTSDTITYHTSSGEKYVTQYYGTYAEDDNKYIINSLEVDRRSTTNLGSEGNLMSYIFAGTVSMAGMAINPTIGFVFMALSFVGLEAMGVTNLGWVVTISIVIICLIIAGTAGNKL
jgi:hypothetical protein